MILYLASSSWGRKMLLKSAHIPFQSIEHSFDEIVTDKKLFDDIEKYTLYVAIKKIDYIIFPPIEKKGTKIIIMSADTMNKNNNGEIIGKPTSYEQSKKYMLDASSGTYYVATGYCINQYCSAGNFWILEESIHKAQTSKICMNFTYNDIEKYLNNIKDDTFTMSGGFSIDGFGMQFAV